MEAYYLETVKGSTKETRIKEIIEYKEKTVVIEFNDGERKEVLKSDLLIVKA